MRRLRISLLAVAAFLGFTAPANAAIILSADPVWALAGDTGKYFDINLTNSGGDISVLAFSFGLSVTDVNITFTRATSATSAAYIFSGRSFDELTLGLPYIDAFIGGSALIASDMDDAGTGVIVPGGSTVALGRVFFDVGAVPAALITVTIDGYPSTNLSDPAIHDIPIDSTVGGVIHTPGYTPIPEPATLLPGGLALLAAFALRRRP